MYCRRLLFLLLVCWDLRPQLGRGQLSPRSLSYSLKWLAGVKRQEVCLTEYKMAITASESRGLEVILVLR